MEHVNGWCFRGIYKGGLWENDLHVSAPIYIRDLVSIKQPSYYFRYENTVQVPAVITVTYGQKSFRFEAA